MILPKHYGKLQRAGMPHYTMEEMAAIQWGEDWQEILDLMKNRMIMGGFRYGPHRNQRKGQFDNVKDAKRRLGLHQKDGNMEHLLDAANITILACLKKAHKNFHFTSIDDGVHAKELK
jgi:hypothetical protein